MDAIEIKIGEKKIFVILDENEGKVEVAGNHIEPRILFEDKLNRDHAAKIFNVIGKLDHFIRVLQWPGN